MSDKQTSYPGVRREDHAHVDNASSNSHNGHENGNGKRLDANGKGFEELVKIGLRTPPPRKGDE